MDEVSGSRKRLIQGVVVGVAGDKSPVVLVERRVLHPKYRKIVKRFRRYVVHDESNSLKIGDFVSALECKPLSRRKSFMLKDIISVGVSE